MFGLTRKAVSKSRSRFGTERIWELQENSYATLTAKDVTDYRILGTPSRTSAFDPDGGPFVCRGQEIDIGKQRYRIAELVSVTTPVKGDVVLRCKVEPLK